MGNYKWNTNDADLTLPWVVVLFVSRNKDNKDLPDFKQRRQAMFCTKNLDKIYKKFKHFVEDGVPGEESRLYISNNARDPKKVRQALLHCLIDKEDFNFEYIEATVAGIAAKKENAVEKKWFFDFDSQNMTALTDFIQDIAIAAPEVHISAQATPHGYAVICDRGFDCRKLLEKWTDVGLKRDDLICIKWERKL